MAPNPQCGRALEEGKGRENKVNVRTRVPGREMSTLDQGEEEVFCFLKIFSTLNGTFPRI